MEAKQKVVTLVDAYKCVFESIVTMMDLGSENGFDDSMICRIFTDKDAYYNSIFKFEQSIHEEPVFHLDTDPRRTVPIAFGPLEIDSYLQMKIRGRTLNKQNFRLPQSRILCRCLSRRLIHMTLGCFHVLKERQWHFFIQQIFNQDALIATINSDLTDRFI